MLCLWGARIGTPSEHQVPRHPPPPQQVPGSKSPKPWPARTCLLLPGTGGGVLGFRHRKAGLVPDSDSPTAALFHPPPLLKQSPTLVSESLRLCAASPRTRAGSTLQGGEGRSLSLIQESVLEKTLVRDWPHWKMPFSGAPSSADLSRWSLQSRLPWLFKTVSSRGQAWSAGASPRSPISGGIAPAQWRAQEKACVVGHK